MNAPPRQTNPPPWLALGLRWIRRLGITAAILAGGFLLMELAAGLLVPGRTSRFLVAGESDGQPAWIDNLFFAYRFFPERTAPTPIPVVALKAPSPGTLRVCLIGDSAAMGAPDPSFGLGRHLELLIQSRYPDHPVEVVHLGLEGGNSHVLREAARDLQRLKPGAVIVFIGNHEVAGPYGPAFGPGRFQHGPRTARWMVLFSRTRLAQLWRAGMTRLFPTRADLQAWRSQENVTLKGRMSPQAPRLETVYRLFRQNLAAILREATNASPAVVTCTVPVNLRDCAPFSTSYLDDEAAAQQVREILRAAKAAEAATNRLEAARLYADAIRINPNHADALYRAGRLALQENQVAEAAKLFTRARDADALRLRADSRINDIIRTTATDASVSLFDAEALFAAHAPQGIPGHELFFDHIHFTYEANYLLATSLLAHLEALRAFARAPAGAVPDSKALAGELLYHPWGRAAQLDAMLKQHLRLPFRRQLTSAETIARLNEEKQVWEANVAALSPANTRAILARHQASRPKDAWLAAWAARLLLNANEPEQAEATALTSYRHWPHRIDIRALLCLIRAIQGQDTRDGIAFLQGNSDNGYQDIESFIAIGRALLARKRPAEARPWLAHALERDPWNSEAIILLAEVLYQLEGRNLAFDNLLKELEQNPRQPRPWTTVFLREAWKQLEPAGRAFDLLQQSIKRNPDSPLLWEKLAVLYTLRSKGNDWQIASRCYTKSEEIAPYRYERYRKWAEAMFRLRQYSRANVVISRYLTFMPHDPEGLALQAKIQAKLPAKPETVSEPTEEKSSRRFPWE